MTGDWRHSAKCRDEDPELWFAPTTYAAGKVDADRAKSICAACPVRQSCEDWAIETQQGVGHLGWPGRGRAPLHPPSRAADECGMTAARDDTNSTGERTMSTQDSPEAPAETLRRNIREPAALALIAVRSCETYTSGAGACLMPGSGRSVTADYGAGRACDPCIALWGLGWPETKDIAAAQPFLGESGDSRG